MKHSIALLLSSLTVTVVASSPGVLQYCNRGFCYTKKEPLDPSSSGRFSKRKSGLNFCTDSGGHVRDCELFEILGTEHVDFEAVECTSSSCKRMQEDIMEQKEPHTQVYSAVDGEVMDLDKNEEHVSWKERPKRGRCYDNALAYEFDCNLVEILE